MRSEGAAPSAACAVIVLAAVFEPAGDTIDVGSDDHSRHDTPVRRPWAIALPSLFSSTLRDRHAVD